MAISIQTFCVIIFFLMAWNLVKGKDGSDVHTTLGHIADLDGRTPSQSFRRGAAPANKHDPNKDETNHDYFNKDVQYSPNIDLPLWIFGGLAFFIMMSCIWEVVCNTRWGVALRLAILRCHWCPRPPPNPTPRSSPVPPTSPAPHNSPSSPREFARVLRIPQRFPRFPIPEEMEMV